MMLAEAILPQETGVQPSEVIKYCVVNFPAQSRRAVSKSTQSDGTKHSPLHTRRRLVQSLPSTFSACLTIFFPVGKKHIKTVWASLRKRPASRCRYKREDLAGARRQISIVSTVNFERSLYRVPDFRPLKRPSCDSGTVKPISRCSPRKRSGTSSGLIRIVACLCSDSRRIHRAEDCKQAPKSVESREANFAARGTLHDG